MTLNSRMTVTTAVACVLVSTVLLPLFTDALWFVIGAGAVIAVAGTGALTRLRTLPVSVCLAATVVGLLLYLNLVFEVRHSLLLVIPTPSSLTRLWHLAGTGFDGTGFDGNGRPDTPRPGRGRGVKGLGPDTRALAAAGRRVGLASIVLALCAPLIVPGLHASKLLSSGPGIGGTGGSGGQSLTLPSALNQAVAQLHEGQPRTLFTYTTNATQAEQAKDAQYFRQYVFDTMGDSGWEVDNYAARSVPVNSIPGPQGLTDSSDVQTVRTTVNAGKDFRSPPPQPTFLPLPYPAIQVTAPGKWLADPDRMVYSTSDSIANQSYSATSVVVDPSQAQLEKVPGLVRTASLAPDLVLPA